MENSSGELTQKISEIRNLEDFFFTQLLESFLSLFTFIISPVILFNISIPVTICAILVSIVIDFLYYLGNRFIGNYMPKVLDKNVELTLKIQEIVLGIFEIRSNNAEELFSKINEKKKLMKRISYN